MHDKFLSDDRKIYLRKVRLNKFVIIITQISLVIFFILLWELLANLNVIDSFITSKPSRVLDTILNLSSNDLLKHLGITFYETIVRFYFWYLYRDLRCNFTLAFKIFIKSLWAVFSSFK